MKCWAGKLKHYYQKFDTVFEDIKLIAIKEIKENSVRKQETSKILIGEWLKIFSIIGRTFFESLFLIRKRFYIKKLIFLSKSRKIY